MTGHRRILSKLKLCLFISCFNRVNDRSKFTEVIVLPSIWSDDMAIETTWVFENSKLGSTN